MAQSQQQQQALADSLRRVAAADGPAAAAPAVPALSRPRPARRRDRDGGEDGDGKRVRRSAFGDAPAANAGEAPTPPPPPPDADAVALPVPPPPPAPAADDDVLTEEAFRAAVREATARAARLLSARKPDAACGKIIGRGGETISSLQASTGASIKVQSSSEVTAGQNRRVTISGLPAAVAAAKREVEAFMRETPVVTGPAIVGGPYGLQPGLGAEDTSGTLVAVPTELFGRVIGRGGETVRRLQEQTGARIQIERDHNQVRIKGGAAAVDAAQRAIREILQNAPGGPQLLGLPAPGGGEGGGGGGGGGVVGGGGGGGGALAALGAPPQAGVSATVPTHGQEGRIIGRGGDTIRDLQQRFGARVQIDRAAGMVTVSAPTQAAVDDCCRAIGALVAATPPAQAMLLASAQMQQQQQQQQQHAWPGYGQPSQQQQPSLGYPGGGGGYQQQQPQLQQQQQQQQLLLQQQQQPPPPPPAAPQPLWTPQSTGEGYTYWYNTQTGESVWERPAGI